MAAFGVADIADAGTVESSGSGFIIHPDGYILSNNHVVDGADKIDVVLHDGAICRAKVIETDPYKDLALLKIEASGLTAPLGDSDELEVAETVMAVGFPLSDIIGSATASAFEGKLNARRDDKIEMLQIDAAVNPGNSGGPLVNERVLRLYLVQALACRWGAWRFERFRPSIRKSRRCGEDVALR